MQIWEKVASTNIHELKVTTENRATRELSGICINLANFRDEEIQTQEECVWYPF